MATTANGVRRTLDGSYAFSDLKINGYLLKEMNTLYEGLKADQGYQDNELRVKEWIVPALAVTGTIGTPDDKTFVGATTTEIPTEQDGQWGFFYTAADFAAATDKELLQYSFSIQKVTISSEGTATVTNDLPAGTDSVIILPSPYHTIQGLTENSISSSATQKDITSKDNNGVSVSSNGNKDYTINCGFLWSPDAATHAMLDIADELNCPVTVRTGDIREVGKIIRVGSFNISDYSRSGAPRGTEDQSKTLTFKPATTPVVSKQTEDDTIVTGLELFVGC